jgi:hypothetical protein
MNTKAIEVRTGVEKFAVHVFTKFFAILHIFFIYLDDCLLRMQI